MQGGNKEPKKFGGPSELKLKPNALRTSKLTSFNSICNQTPAGYWSAKEESLVHTPFPFQMTPCSCTSFSSKCALQRSMGCYPNNGKGSRNALDFLLKKASEERHPKLLGLQEVPCSGLPLTSTQVSYLLPGPKV